MLPEGEVSMSDDSIAIVAEKIDGRWAVIAWMDIL